MNGRFLTHAIVLDTNCFGKINNYNFKKSKVTICVGGLKNYNNIKIFLPSIVYEEIKKHIKYTVGSVLDSVKSSYVKNYLELSIFEDIYDKKVKELDDFIKENHVEIIDCNLFVDIAQVNSWYFKGEKPFSVSKPKEFPDAMILSAAINFFKKNKFDEVIFICEDDVFCDGVKRNTNFRVEKDLSKVMNDLIGIEENDYRKCESYIKSKEILCREDSYSFTSYDVNDSYFIDGIKAIVNNFEIIAKEDDYYQVCVHCSLDIDGEFNFVDQELSVYDSYDPECSAIFIRNGNNLEIDDAEVYITLYFDNNKNINKYEIEYIDDVILSNYYEQLELIN